MTLNPERFGYRLKEGAETVAGEPRPDEAERKDLWNETFTTERTGKYPRYLAILRLIKSYAPEGTFTRKTIGRLLRISDEHLPFDTEHYQLDTTDLGNRSEVRVYLLESKTDKNPSLAIKVFRPRENDKDRVATAKQLRREGEEIRELYREIPDLIPKEHYLVMEDPFFKGRSAVTIIQEFIHGRMDDIFSFAPQELARLAEENPELGKNLIKFIEITLKEDEEHQTAIDFLGPKNVSIIGGGRLILIDPHFRASTHPSENNEEAITRAELLKQKLDFLKETLELIKKAHVGTA